MAVPFIIAGVAVLLTGLVVVFWHHIFDVFSQYIIPFLRQHVPALTPLVEHAFLKLDGVVTSVRRAAKEAWRRVRAYVFHAQETYERTAPGEYTATQTTYATTDKQDEVHKVTTSRRVPLDDLPDEIRAKIVQSQRPTTDILDARDQELEMAH